VRNAAEGVLANEEQSFIVHLAGNWSLATMPAHMAMPDESAKAKEITVFISSREAKCGDCGAEARARVADLLSCVADQWRGSASS
jgi:hypothetical protein